ncbi:hypothetical protein SAMN00768000_0229 [Sulfobacillus thermosulfidooxidans DSM 9293]|uniref:Uncharacterized protein n=1 Tax=Sulfobacillus thermosulfidooxidans (strain DSM 9293 / VKM B-1269 / AT-1) TaxID=929705 RepID=A0A1W1W7I8_SULTA|nr:hypothetical protein [Sulfobacillus thermosulfidooxidans]SMC02020.1 hypothetical protein SAMN00768000_0229 [Sulfobacillus thermosulfidooxidans DSM 9293]
MKRLKSSHSDADNGALAVTRIAWLSVLVAIIMIPVGLLMLPVAWVMKVVRRFWHRPTPPGASA